MLSVEKHSLHAILMGVAGRELPLLENASSETEFILAIRPHTIF